MPRQLQQRQLGNKRASGADRRTSLTSRWRKRPVQNCSPNNSWDKRNQFEFAETNAAKIMCPHRYTWTEQFQFSSGTKTENPSLGTLRNRNRVRRNKAVELSVRRPDTIEQLPKPILHRFYWRLISASNHGQKQNPQGLVQRLSWSTRVKLRQTNSELGQKSHAPTQNQTQDRKNWYVLPKASSPEHKPVIGKIILYLTCCSSCSERIPI